MSVGYLPPGLPTKKLAKIAHTPLSLVQWPLGGNGKKGLVGDLTQDDHLLMCMSSRALLLNRDGLKCRLSLMLFEPPAIHARYYRVLPFVARRFHRIFTYNGNLLRRIPNARFQTHGGATVQIPENRSEKTDRISLIASKKRTTAGHRLRHEIAQWSRTSATDLVLLGRSYYPLEDKADGHLPYQFSVVLENCREPSYFTEKLIDSFLCLSLPIYWGAPDITQFFDPRGMIICASEAELKQAILEVSERDFHLRLPYLRENCERAKKYIDPWLNIAEYLITEDQFGLRTQSLAEDVRVA